MLGLGLYYGARKNLKLALVLVALALAGLLFDHFVRCASGNCVNFGAQFIAPWIHAPIATFVERISDPTPWKSLALIFLPFAPIAAWAFKHRVPCNWPMAAVGATYLAIRFVSMRWGYHYDIALSASLLGIFMFEKKVVPPKRVVAATALLLLLAFIPNLGRVTLKTYFRGGLKHCPASPTRLQEIAEAHALFRTSPKPILAMGNLLPRILWHPEVFHLESMKPSQIPTVPYYVWIEKGETGDAWPIGIVADRKLISELEGKSRKILEGRFTDLTEVDPTAR